VDIRLAPTEAERRSESPSRYARCAKNHEMGFLCHIGESCPRKEFLSHISLSEKTQKQAVHKI
jgi:hypothetical protein